MTKKKMSTDSVSHNADKCGYKDTRIYADKNLRLLNYKKFAVAFSYPDENFFKFFPQLMSKKEEMPLAYDTLFRVSEFWLYGSEYIAQNEFQRANNLADINGFYCAFGLETNMERPDSLPCELEFMHYLIYKETRAPDEKKASICRDAQGKFFREHLYPAAKGIAETVSRKSENSFYKNTAEDMLEFLECERPLYF